MPKAGQTILWKRYGFRHILKDDRRTFCGTDVTFNVAWNSYVVYGKEAERRPLCGTCRRLAKKGDANV